ncbi:hypothetical protein K438DRAFT_1781745 [Mycena galopus ATCC 62051]|nr:hypothetical protein K438DRAFT_1781745 [Mycena galopus ATCC 62051]
MEPSLWRKTRLESEYFVQLEKLEKMWTSGACAGMRIRVGIGNESPSKCQRVASKMKSNVENVRAEHEDIFSPRPTWSTLQAEGISISPVLGAVHAAWFGWVLGRGAGFGFASVYAYLEPELEGEAISPLGDNGMVGEEIEQGWNINAVEKVENRRE